MGNYTRLKYPIFSLASVLKRILQISPIEVFKRDRLWKPDKKVTDGNVLITGSEIETEKLLKYLGFAAVN